jgi:murein L,D-transpeptidase YcbB/YkuD
MEFQKSQGLIFDGICGPLTRDKLKKEYEKRLEIKV